MLKVAVFAAVLLAAVIYAIRRGGAPERWAAGLMTAAFIATVAQPYNDGSNYDRFFGAMFVIDTALFVGLAFVALRANRFWPLWVAALQLLTLAVHLAKAYDPDVLPIVYARVSGEIGYVMLALLVAGVGRLQDRIRANGGELDWSPVR